MPGPVLQVLTRQACLQLLDELSIECEVLTSAFESIHETLTSRPPSHALYLHLSTELDQYQFRLQKFNEDLQRINVYLPERPSEIPLSNAKIENLNQLSVQTVLAFETFHDRLIAIPSASSQSFINDFSLNDSNALYCSLPSAVYVDNFSDTSDGTETDVLYNSVFSSNPSSANSSTSNSFSLQQSLLSNNSNPTMANDTALLTAVPLFDAETPSFTVKDYIQNIETIGTMGGWNEAKKIIVGKLRLSGKAKELISRNPYCNSINAWDDFKQILLDAFHIPRKKTDIERELINIKQTKNERVGQYALRVEALAAKLKPAHGANADVNRAFDDHFNSKKLLYFVNGLLPSYRSFVRIKAPADYDAAKEYAKEAEKLKSEREGEEHEDTSIFINKVDELKEEINNLKIKSEPTCAAISTDVMTHREFQVFAQELKNDIKQHLFAYRNSGRSAPRWDNRRFQGTCHYCQIVGHKIADCRKRARDFGMPATQTSPGPSRSRDETRNPGVYNSYRNSLRNPSPSYTRRSQSPSYRNRSQSPRNRSQSPSYPPAASRQNDYARGYLNSK